VRLVLPSSLVAVLAATALAWHRHSVAVFGAVLLIDAVAEPLLPEAAVVPAVPLAAWIALYFLAVDRPARTALAGAALASGVVTAPFVRVDSAWQLLDELLAGALLHLLIVLCGQLQRHRIARRARVAARLAEAEALRRAAAAAERERLARELHDAAGHHLTAVAVQGAAALRLADPDGHDHGQALVQAAASGREVLAALGGLADAPPVGENGALQQLVPPLCEGLERLGFPITLAIEGRQRPLPRDVVTAGYRIVQESLTNAMRYASGAPVTVRLRYRRDELTIAVTNAPPPGPSSTPGLGTGRGIAGLAERAVSVGGRLAAGPEAGGGWSVLATFPLGARPAPFDLAAFAACTALPLLALPHFHPHPGVAALLAAHALPLLWRRRAPVAALAAMLAVALAWAVAMPAGLTVLAFTSAAELLAIHTVASRVRSQVSWLAPFAVGAVAGAVFGLAAGENAGVTALLGLTAAPWLLPLWLLGLLARARRGEGGRWEERALDAMAARVGETVAAERRAIAAGLRGAVVAPTLRLVRRAESGDATAAALTDVTRDARQALTGLRELLEAVR
jgi:signal transduction histidine kinase